MENGDTHDKEMVPWFRQVQMSDYNLWKVELAKENAKQRVWTLSWAFWLKRAKMVKNGLMHEVASV